MVSKNSTISKGIRISLRSSCLINSRGDEQLEDAVFAILLCVCDDYFDYAFMQDFITL